MIVVIHMEFIIFFLLVFAGCWVLVKAADREKAKNVARHEARLAAERNQPPEALR